MKTNIGSIIGLVVIVTSLLVVAIVLFTSISIRQEGRTDVKTVTAPITRAQGVDCLVQMRKVELAVQAYSIENEKHPRSLDEITVLTVQDLNCPVTGCRYSYDSLTGKISCSCRN